MYKGKIRQAGSGTFVDVVYTLNDLAFTDVTGRIWIGGDPLPAAQFMADPNAVFPRNLDYTLETGTGVEVLVRFTDAGGDFRCPNPSEARAALVILGHGRPMPGEVISLVGHSSLPARRPANRDLH